MNIETPAVDTSAASLPVWGTLPRRWSASALIALGLAAAAPASATSTYADARASVAGANDDFHSDTGILGSQASANLVSSVGAVNVHGEAAAYVGALHVSSLARASVGTDAQANTHAQWSDAFQMVSAGHAGERGTFTAAVGVQGGLLAEITGLSYADTYVVANFYVNTGADGGNVSVQGGGRRTVGYDTGSTSSGQESFSLYFDNLPFIFGQDIAITLRLATTSATRTFGTSQARAEADYGHTMTWSGLSNVRDAAGNLLTNFTAISAGSGFDFANPTPVPEPGSAALLALGLFGIGGWMRRKSHGSRTVDLPVPAA